LKYWFRNEVTCRAETEFDPEKKISSCFFKADESKIGNCVSVSAAALNIEAPINANKNHPIKHRRWRYSLGVRPDTIAKTKGFSFFTLCQE
jgi:hypothetical protein